MRRRVFVIPSDPSHLTTLRRSLARFLRGSRLSLKTRHEILVALGEACTNSIQHAYEGRPGKVIRVKVEDLEDRLVFKIRDYGRKIKLSQVRTPRLPSRKPGGLGIYFMKTVMDDLRYNTAHLRGNELILVKYKKGPLRGKR